MRSCVLKLVKGNLLIGFFFFLSPPQERADQPLLQASVDHFSSLLDVSKFYILVYSIIQ